MHPDARVGALASKQHGLINRSQAYDLGLSKGAIQRRLSDRRWIRVAPSVFRLAGAPESWTQRLLAECLSLGQGAVASHLAAARLWRLDGLPDTWDLEVMVGSDRSPRRRPEVILHRTRGLDPRDCERRNATPVTSVTRTLIDLASVLPSDKLELACADAFRRTISNPGRVWSCLHRIGTRGRAGLAKLTRILLTYAPAQAETHSALEGRVLQALRKAGLEPPVSQFNVVEDDRWLGQVDFAYPEQKVLIEAEGLRFHHTPSRHEQDTTRFSELSSAGWSVIRVTWNGLKRRERAFIEQVERALMRAGCELSGLGCTITLSGGGHSDRGPGGPGGRTGIC